MEKRETLIKGLRYYKGEERNPFSGGDGAMFWECEKKWVDMFLAEDETLMTYWNDFYAYGLLDFAENDGTPTTLKALLFNRYSHWFGYVSKDGKEFKEWYNKTYIGYKRE